MIKRQINNYMHHKFYEVTCKSHKINSGVAVVLQNYVFCITLAKFHRSCPIHSFFHHTFSESTFLLQGVERLGLAEKGSSLFIPLHSRSESNVA